jgi:ABC-type microcin C transport system permease subunit YejE
MKPTIRALVVTAIAGALLYVFNSYTQHRVQQAIAEGWDLSQGFRIQIGIANLLHRLWWILLPLFGLFCWLGFTLLDERADA